VKGSPGNLKNSFSTVQNDYCLLVKFLQALDDEGGWRGKCIALRQIEQQLAAHARLASKDARELVKFMVRKRLLNIPRVVSIDTKPV